MAGELSFNGRTPATPEQIAALAAAIGSADIPAGKLVGPAAAQVAASTPGIVGGPYSGTALLKWRLAVGKMRFDGTRPTVLCIGDSKTAGASAGPGFASSALNSYPYRLAQLLTAKGIAASAESMWGENGNAPLSAEQAYDPRRSGFTGWTYSNQAVVPGVGGLVHQTTGTNPGIFTPVGPVDRVDVWYRIPPGGVATAAATVTADGSPTVLGNIPSSTVSQITKVTVNLGTLASHAINVNPDGTGTFYLIGMVAYDSTKPAVNVYNWGVNGAQAALWASATGRFSFLNAMAAQLAIINLGTNDMLSVGATDVTAWTATLQALITQLKTTASVVLVWPAIGRNAGSSVPQILVSDAQRLPYYTALVALAKANDCVLVDEQALFGDRDTAQAAGVFADNLHEVGPAYAAEAQLLVSLLAA